MTVMVAIAGRFVWPARTFAIPNHDVRTSDIKSHAVLGSARYAGLAMNALRRVLRYEVSVGALIEVALWLAIPYLSIGFVWALLHADETARIQTRLESVAPSGADVAAFGLTAALWPASIQIAHACPAR
jgi:hypothetical protein